MSDPILVKKFKRDSSKCPGVRGPIEYPDATLPMILFTGTDIKEDIGDIIDFTELEKYREGEFNISNVETLDVPQRLIRGIVKYKGEEFYFSGRIDMMLTGFRKIDLDALLQAVTLRIRDGEYAE
jgi:hypothetical protein